MIFADGTTLFCCSYRPNVICDKLREGPDGTIRYYILQSGELRSILTKTKPLIFTLRYPSVLWDLTIPSKNINWSKPSKLPGE